MLRLQRSIGFAKAVNTKTITFLPLLVGRLNKHAIVMPSADKLECSIACDWRSNKSNVRELFYFL